MKVTFKVGGKYRNRKGEYEVLELDGPRMLIRYTDGQVLNAHVEMQARIRANMQAEKVVREHQAAQRRSATRTRRTPSRGAHFTGLVEGDFQRGVAGTNWRSRKSLGGLLAQRLSVHTNQPFQSDAPYRQPRVHIIRPEHYNKKASRQKAKFLLALNPECARYGLYIEKNDGPMDESWHWPNLMAALAADKALQEETLAAMRRLGLHWEIYTYPNEGATQATAGADGLQWQPAGGESEAISWGEFLQRLANVSENENTWCDLYLWTRTDKDPAIAAGAGIAETAVQVYRALLPLYRAAIRGNS